MKSAISSCGVTLMHEFTPLYHQEACTLSPILMRSCPTNTRKFYPANAVSQSHMSYSTRKVE